SIFTFLYLYISGSMVDTLSLKRSMEYWVSGYVLANARIMDLVYCPIPAYAN
ncbi:MAG: hypothetical protein US29_C0006G0018, partial [candidate division WS6 bacterium GW2011_GWF1_36_8]